MLRATLFFLADWLPVLFMAAFAVIFIAICVMGGSVSIKINGILPALRAIWRLLA